MQALRLIDPVITFRNSQGDSVRGTLTSLQRRALVMEIYNPYSIVQVSEMLSELTVRSGDRTIYKGAAVVASLLNTGLMAVVSVTLLSEWSELAAIARDRESVGREARRFVDEFAARFTLRRDYQVVVSELRSYFAEVTRWIDQADVTAALPRDPDGRLREDVFFELAQPLLEKGQEFLLRFEAEARLVEEDRAALHRSFAQSAIHPLVLRAPFVHRTFTKPLGYAGDYEMVNQIVGDPRQGPSTYFQIINYVFLQAGVARAHRNRIDILIEGLAELARQGEARGERLRVLNVGCGPAHEIERLIETTEASRWLEFTLVDFSEETLAYAETRLRDAAARHGRELHLTLQHESVNQLLKRGARQAEIPPSARYSHVYCAGLLDYLSDKVCTRLAEYFRTRLVDGGTLLLTNVHVNNRERLWMEHFLEWYLIYRDERSLAAVMPPGFDQLRTFTDSTGVNVFLTARAAPAAGSP